MNKDTKNDKHSFVSESAQGTSHDMGNNLCMN